MCGDAPLSVEQAARDFAAAHTVRSLAVVSTRKLILTAFVCGMAILIAGGALFLKLRNHVTIDVIEQGQAVGVGPYTVTAVGSSVSGVARVVHVRVVADATAPPVPDLEGAFSLTIGEIRPRQDPPPGATPCRKLALAPGTSAECDVAFAELAKGTPYLAFRGLGTVEVRWRLVR